MNTSLMIHAELAVQWTEKDAVHRDRTIIRKINFWRDLFPDGLENILQRAAEGETVKKPFLPGSLTAPYDADAVRDVPASAFERTVVKPGVIPRAGRFYPRGVLASALGCFPQDIRPLRVEKTDNGRIRVNLNHPLSVFPLTLEASVHRRTAGTDERGGSVRALAETVTEDGPGMQARADGSPTDFWTPYPFQRRAEEADAGFYQKPRFVYHIDRTAAGHVTALYKRLLKPGFKVLDLMSSWVSHLPGDLPGMDVIGLGMNAEELNANPALSGFRVHDLNLWPRLPFADQHFDAVICTASVEYLTRPLEVFVEAARVLKPGGVFVNTFSDRWFPPKVVRLWEALHPFERMGLVLECLRESGGFTDLHTESIRGDIRPSDDKYAHVRIDADPLFGVWGRRK